ncbi:MAG: hypothetical protein ABI353_16275 [Isosphaeraceae bacterium]
MSAGRHRYSTTTNQSILTAVPVAVLQFVGSLTLVRAHPTFPTLPALFLTIFAPFLSFIVLAAIIHRRSFTFDETEGTLTIQEWFVGLPIGESRSLPIESIGQVEFIERTNSEGDGWTVAIEIKGRSYEVTESVRRSKARARFAEIRGIVDRARKSTHRTA